MYALDKVRTEIYFTISMHYAMRLLLWLLPLALWGQTVKFTILTFNDVYTIVPDENGVGGFAQMATLLAQERKKAEHHITVVNGDFLSPSLLSSFDQGAHRVELFHLMGVDLVALGNHEFDFGPQVLRKRLGESHFPWLAANVFGEDGRPFTGDVQTFIVDAEGIRIGFFGLLTPETVQLSSTEHKVYFTPLAHTATLMIEALKRQGADVIIAVTHLLIAEDRQLVKEVPAIDFILGGHDHEPITWGDGRTLIHKSGQDARFLGRIDLVIDKQGDQVKIFPSWRMVLNRKFQPDPIVAHRIGELEAQLSCHLEAPICVLQNSLESLHSHVRSQETSMGNLITDAMRASCDAEVALLSGGILRGDQVYDLHHTLTMRDLVRELPFPNLIVMVELLGRDLLEALENGVSQWAHRSGRFLQVSGLCFSFDPESAVGERVKEVRVGGEPLRPEGTYRVATVGYLLDGGDGYDCFTRGRVLLDKECGLDMRDAVAKYLRQHGTQAKAGRIYCVRQEEGVSS